MKHLIVNAENAHKKMAGKTSKIIGKLCKEDKAKVEKMKSWVQEKDSKNLFEVLKDPLTTICHNAKILGQRDGGVTLCLDEIMTNSKDCIIHSIGLGTSINFERRMEQLGCSIFAFDALPSKEVLSRLKSPFLPFIFD